MVPRPSARRHAAACAPPQIAVAFVPEPVVVVVSPTSDGRLAIAPASTGPPDVGDASLLRQHCALIV
jgi:hypothetical protein